MPFPPDVERWRATVTKYFPPELVDKALYVIQRESGGNPGAVGDGGAARGLFQIQDKRNFSNRPDAAYLDDPENNIKYAAEQLGGAGGNWGAWGEGTTKNGAKFGALGNNPYPGDTGGAGGGTTVTQPRGNGHFPDPQQDADYEELKGAYLRADAAWNAAGQPGESSPLWAARNDARDYYYAFTDRHGYPTAASAAAGEKEVTNRISLGDFDARQANSAFKLWYDKYSMARTETNDALTAAAKHNADNVALQEARNKSQTPGLLPHVTDAGYIEQSRSELMDEYLKRAGITREAPAYQSTGLGTPGQSALSGPTGADSMGFNGPGGAMNAGLEPQPKNSLDLFREAESANQGAGWTPEGKPNPPPWKNAQYVPPPDMSEGFDWGGAAKKVAAGVAGISMPALLLPAASAYLGGGAAKKAGKVAKKGWKRVFAAGGTNIPGGPAWVGEKGPEIMEVPGFGQKIVGQNGPEQVNVPEGANIMPVNEAFQFHQIQSAVRDAPQRDRMRQVMEQEQRRNDPQLQEKVMASIQKAMASEWAANPPFTPMIPPGGKDYWAGKRLISGTPATAEEAAMQQQAAAKGGGR